MSLLPEDAFASTRRSIEDAAEVSLTSVGIDVGSSTSQLVISDLQLALVGGAYRLATVRSRHVSDVFLTPYASAGRIDALKLRGWAAGQFAAAGTTRSEIDAGAVLLTGNALTKSNARRIANELSEACGDLVAAAAGPDLEAMLAARGSGALALSAREGLRLLHVDIGGGTTKFALCELGAITATAAIDVGARIVAFDADEQISRIEPSGIAMARDLGLQAKLGATSAGVREVMAASVAARILEFVASGTLAEPHASLMLTDPIGAIVATVDVVTISGGVAEFVHGREDRDFGDLGGPVGARIANHFANRPPVPLRPLPVGIRATVIGASRYTVQLSGQTIYVEPPSILPIRNAAVVRLPEHLFEGEIRAGVVRDVAGRAIRKRLAGASIAGPLALLLPWSGSATFDRLDAACSGVLSALRDQALEQPVIVLTSGDLGGLVGIHLSRELGASRVVSLDGLSVGDLDYLDIGTVLDRTGTVPVVIKSLLFPMSATE